MGMYDYSGRGTYLNGFYKYLENNHPNIISKINTFGDLNEPLKAIRLRKEPNKPVSKNIEKNSFYIQEKLDWKEDVVEYFKEFESKLLMN